MRRELRLEGDMSTFARESISVRSMCSPVSEWRIIPPIAVSLLSKPAPRRGGNSRLLQPRFSVPSGVGPFGQVTRFPPLGNERDSFIPHRRGNSLGGPKPFSVRQVWGTRGHSRHAGFTSDQMEIRKEQHSRTVYRIQRKQKRGHRESCCSISPRIASLQNYRSSA